MVERKRKEIVVGMISGKVSVHLINQSRKFKGVMYGGFELAHVHAMSCMLFYFSDNFEITAVPERIMTDDWTEPVRGLWQHLLLDFSAEQDFNVKISQKLPHCSICALFKPLQVSFGIVSL